MTCRDCYKEHVAQAFSYYGLLTDREFMDRDGVNKRFIVWFSGRFFSRDTAGSPERARLTARVDNHSGRFGSSAHEASHVTKEVII